ncbi:hypothetical protein Pmar_PMAR010927, partial [Perkinsus marinus ATCC 50983]
RSEPSVSRTHLCGLSWRYYVVALHQLVAIRREIIILGRHLEEGVPLGLGDTSVSLLG